MQIFPIVGNGVVEQFSGEIHSARERAQTLADETQWETVVLTGNDSYCAFAPRPVEIFVID